MNNNRPETIAIRTVNQYRRRDILAYLSIRYYVENLAARTDYWANNAAIDLVLTSLNSSYCKTHHFKEIDGFGKITYREIFLPTANEAIAEAALLAECSRHPVFADNPSCVFSYNLTKGSDRTGVFQPYINGLRARQKAIERACKKTPTGIVRHTDLKRFYPTISLDLAEKIWEEKCDLTDIDKRFRVLGRTLISRYRNVKDNDSGTLLVGPALSHFIANMVLKDIDIYFLENLPVKYFRYVDDITLVGDTESVNKSIQLIASQLDLIGLSLHNEASPKNMQGSTKEWLKYKDDFHEGHRKVSWKSLIGDLKRFLVLHPEMKESLEEAFLKEGFRVPIFDYVVTTKERSFLEKFVHFASKFLSHNHSITIESLLSQCRYLRKSYLTEVYLIIKSLHPPFDFDRKSKIPKIRYRSGRLIYLALHEELLALSNELNSIPELYFYSEVMRSIVSKNIDMILSLGPNCAQAACQPIKSEKVKVFTTIKDLTHVQEQSLAIFELHSITVEGEYQVNSELIRFAKLGCDKSLMLSDDSFIREISCLHGIVDSVRHSEILNSMLDEDEEFALDAIEQFQESLSP